MKTRQRLIDGEIPFRVARDLTAKRNAGDEVAIAAALYEILPDSTQPKDAAGWMLAGRLEAISRHPKYGRKQVPK